jgi:signal transduction histidine kinase
MRLRFWLPVVTISVVIGLGALAHVQWTWITVISRSQEEHERRVLDFAARQFASEFDRDVASILSGAEHARPENMYVAARDPHLVAGVYIAHENGLDQIDPKGDHHPVEWPHALAAVRARLEGDGIRRRSPIEPTAPAIVLPMFMRHGPDSPPMPLFAPRPPIMIVLLDRAYITQHLFPDLAHRLGSDFDIAVSDGQRVIYRSNPRWSGAHAEASVPMLHDSGWQIVMRNHGGAIADIVARSRLQNLLVSSHVMLLLVAGFALLAIMARRAERLREQQLEFVAGMTHELNTPIAALRSAGENLADGLVHDDAQVARYGAMVAKESHRLGDLVAQVLDYSGLQARQKIARLPVDIPTVIANAIDATRWLAEEKQVELQQSIAGDLPRVAGDAEALARAVQNLIANAIRHGGEGHWVGITAVRSGDNVAITVEDRGPGIAAQDAAHLFERFYRGRNATARGTGLGLTIVSQIARAHGGTIAFDRRRTRGASFTLTLPAVPHA